MFVSPAFAQAAGGQPGGFGLVELFPFVLIFVIMYFLIIRPQQKRAKEHREMLSKLRRGDEIITQGGMMAKITKVKDDDEEVEAEIGRAGTEPVRVRLVKSTITMVLSKTEPAGKAAGGAKSTKGEKSGKPANANKQGGKDAEAKPADSKDADKEAPSKEDGDQPGADDNAR